jgi:hypothetical protein
VGKTGKPGEAAGEKRNRPGIRKEAAARKGYLTDSGYMGFVNGRYMLFTSEDEYMDYMEEN